MSVTLVCPKISIDERYCLALIDLLTRHNMHVDVLTSNNFETALPSDHGLSYHQINLPNCNLLKDLDKVSFWVFKEQNQLAIEQFCSWKKSKILIYVARDADSNFQIDRPLKVLSVICVLCNYYSIPQKTQSKLTNFSFVVSTGLLSDSLLKRHSKTSTSLIFPKFISATNDNNVKSTLDFRRKMNMRQDKFIYLLDINLYIEIKSADAVIKAYSELLADEDFKRDTWLIINGLPFTQLQHILSLENFTPDNVSVLLTYYQNGLCKKDDMIENLIGSCNVFVHAVSGGDFDEHANLAQQLGKLVIYSDSDIHRQYYPYGIKVKSSQSYYEGLNQAFLRIPKIAEVKSAIYSAYEARARLSPGTKVQNCMRSLSQKYDRFEEQWHNILKGTVL